MTKLLISSVAAVAVTMMSSAAFAQQASYGTMTQSTEVTRTARPVEPDYKSTKQERIVDQNGNTVVKNQVYTQAGGGTASTSTAKTIAPDGSVTTQSSEEKTTTPFGETHSTSRTITTDR